MSLNVSVATIWILVSVVSCSCGCGGQDGGQGWVELPCRAGAGPQSCDLASTDPCNTPTAATHCPQGGNTSTQVTKCFRKIFRILRQSLYGHNACGHPDVLSLCWWPRHCVARVARGQLAARARCRLRVAAPCQPGPSPQSRSGVGSI